ncbi:cytochrome c maturation protein CcmE [Sporomusa aerivorans]|uniref:cytochrome c maturation protein CcmE domain-containing protein n=1 Tax=Sporomusa aerivorans TaxID=204936 RepID=UPI00352A49E6
MKSRRLVCLGIIAAFMAYCVYAFQDSVTPYVTFAQAKERKTTVQVKGLLATPRITPTGDGKTIRFILRDDAGAEAAVLYKGIQPEGLEQATGIVAIGRYLDGEFHADKLLVKCPSKYQGSVKK